MKEYNREILDYTEAQSKMYEHMDEQLKRNPNYQPKHDFIDALGKNYLNDRLIPDEDSDTSKFVLQILKDFLH